MFAIKKTDKFGNISYFCGIERNVYLTPLFSTVEDKRPGNVMLYSDESTALSHLPQILDLIAEFIGYAFNGQLAVVKL